MNSQQYSPSGFRTLTPVVKNLLILNGLMYIATISVGKAFNIDLNDILGLRYFGADKFQPYQFITYMFMHSTHGIGHILFNMFALWMFGNVIESTWGGKRFLIYYLFTGIGAALVHYAVMYFEIAPTIRLLNAYIEHPGFDTLNELLANHKFTFRQFSGEIYHSYLAFQGNIDILNQNPDNFTAQQPIVDFIIEYKKYYLNLPNVIGASGAVFGILLAFGMMFPNSLIYLYFAIPVKAKWVVIGYGVIELYSGFANSGGNVAHFAHLGGMIFGFILIKFWYRK